MEKIIIKEWGNAALRFLVFVCKTRISKIGHLLKRGEGDASFLLGFGELFGEHFGDMLLRGVNGRLCRAVAVVGMVAHLGSTHGCLDLAKASMRGRLRSLLRLLLLRVGLRLLLTVRRTLGRGGLTLLAGALVHDGWIQ